MAASPTLTDVPLERSTSKDLQRIANRLETNRNERDALILKAYGEGASLREIANLLGINHVTVRNIIIKRTGGTPDDTRI